MGQSAWSSWQGVIRNRPAVETVAILQAVHLRAVVLRWTPIAIVLGLAMAFRVLDIGRVGLNSDESVYSGQAATLMGDTTMSQFFSAFRAHPLLLQISLGGLFTVFGINDLAARLFVSLTFGAGSVVLTYLLANKLYGPRVAIGAGVIMALLPYHVLVSRQVLVDMPMAFFVLLALWFVSRSKEDASGRWLLWASLSSGLAVTSKETGILVLPVVGSFLICTGGWRHLPLSRVVAAIILFAVIVAPYLISRLLFSPADGSGYLLWQFSRPANHDAWYFLRVLGEFGGLAFGVLVVLGLGRMVRARGMGDILILLWIAVFFAFFQLWPTKLFQYLVVIVPALCIAAGLGLELAASAVGILARGFVHSRVVTSAVIVVALAALGHFLAGNSLAMIQKGPEVVAGPLQFDVEVQDFAGGRELGYWAREHTPPDARFLTIGHR